MALTASARIGKVTEVIGDINGDGFRDIMALSENKLTVIYGSTSTANINLASFSSSQGFTITGYFPTIGSTGSYLNSYFTAISDLGDINNDGLDDVIFGSVNKTTYLGTFYVLYGSRTLQSMSTSDTSKFASVFSISNCIVRSGLGGAISVSGAGDFNGDGYRDIILGVASYNTSGVSYLIFGGPTLSTVQIPFMNAKQGITITGVQFGQYVSYSGFSVSTAGDFNGDGFDDVIIGAPYADSLAGISYVIYGSANCTDIMLVNIPFSQGLTIFGGGKYSPYNLNGDRSGYSVGCAGDFNNDGFSDVVIGAPFTKSNFGAAYIVYGSDSFQDNIVLYSITIDQGMRIYGYQPTYVGFVVTGGTDVNGDGIDDVVIGAPPNSNAFRGGAYVIYGSTTPLLSIHLASLSSSDGYWITGSYAYSGLSVSSGDFNRDGYADVIIGSPYYPTILNKTVVYGYGTAFIVFGQEAGLSTFSLATITTVSKVLCGSTITTSVAIAGDINGDGFLDALIGGQSSASVSVYVAYGGTGGFRTIGNLGRMISYQGYNISTPNTGEGFGYSISGAGDVNGDGIQDFIIGSPYANKTTGYVCIIFGTRRNRLSFSISQLPASDGLKLPGKAFGGYFGWSVRYAGDFDGDGYDDVIIGAPYAYSRTGEVYIVFGGPDITSVNSFDTNATMTLTGVVPKGFFGYRVSGAGDFNGDGYDDVIIGASPSYNSKGAVFILFGSSSREHIDIGNLTASGRGIMIVGSAVGDHFGSYVRDALDVNGDGYADVVVGAVFANNNAGKAYVLYGTSTPHDILLSSLASYGFMMSGGPSYYAGFRVGPAGDVDGDGFPDVLVVADSPQLVYIIYGGKSNSDIYLPDITASQGFYIYSSSYASYAASAADKFSNALFLIGTFGAFFLVTPTAIMPTSLTIAPTAIPTANPTPFPTYLPTKPPPPTFWDQNQAIILGVVIPSVFGFVPIYFSKQICFYVLDHWDSNNRKRGLFQIGIYTLCKRVFLADYVESKELKDKSKEIKETARLLDPKDVTRESEAGVKIEMTTISRHNQEFAEDDDSVVLNPMNCISPLGDSEAFDQVEDRRPIYSPSSNGMSQAVHHPFEIPAERMSQRFMEPDSDDDEDEDVGAHSHVDVIVKAIYQIRYDNPLLNEPQILDILLQAKHTGNMDTIDKMLAGHLNEHSSIATQPTFSRYSRVDDSQVYGSSSSHIVSIGINHPGKPLFSVTDRWDVVNLLLSAREIVEAVPFIRHLCKRCAISRFLPFNATYEWMTDNRVLITSHLVLGSAAAMHTGDFKYTSLITSTASSLMFGLRLRASRYLSDMRSQLLAMVRLEGSASAFQYCATSAIIHTLPSVAVYSVMSLGVSREYINLRRSYLLNDFIVSLVYSSIDCYDVYSRVGDGGIDDSTKSSLFSLLGFVLNVALLVFLAVKCFKIKIFNNMMIVISVILRRSLSFIDKYQSTSD
jgi:hypothetical protein